MGLNFVLSRRYLHNLGDGSKTLTVRAGGTRPTCAFLVCYVFTASTGQCILYNDVWSCGINVWNLERMTTLVLPRSRRAQLVTATRVTLSPKFATLAMISRGERIEPRSQTASAHIPTQGLFRRRGLSSPALAQPPPPPPRSPARSPLQQCLSSPCRPWDSSSEPLPACLPA